MSAREKKLLKNAPVPEQWQLMGSGAAETQASKIFAGLSFPNDIYGRPTKSFNGDWRMRISSARVLVEQLTLSLLDKAPDNLDFRPVLRLEEYICRWKRKKLVCHMFGITLTPLALRSRILVIFIRLLWGRIAGFLFLFLGKKSKFTWSLGKRKLMVSRNSISRSRCSDSSFSNIRRGPGSGLWKLKFKNIGLLIPKVG